MNRRLLPDWAVVVLALAIPFAWIAAFITLVFVDTRSASACGYLAGGTWLVAVLLHAARSLPATIAGGSDAFDVRLAALALAGLLASIGVDVLTRADAVDVPTGITGQAVVGAFGLAALLWAFLQPASRP